MEKVCPHCRIAQQVTKYGTDRSDNQRYQCGACGRKFSEKPKLKSPGRKTPRKGIKSTRGRAEDYPGEVKGNKVCLVMTQTGLQGLDAQAQSIGVSRSEYVERIGRGLIPVSTVQSVQTTIAPGRSEIAQ